MFSRAILNAMRVGLFLSWAMPGGAAELKVHEFTSRKLQGNPLGDPVTRQIAVFVPDGSSAETPMGLVIYLPGWGGSSVDAIDQGRKGWLGGVIDSLAVKGILLRLAVVDGRSRFGGSQFLNSPATGKYADYVSEEVTPYLHGQYKQTAGCLVAGHSSGAYGALMLAMAHPSKFSAVVALSPDSDFETTHKPLVEQAAVRAVTVAELDAALAPAGQFRLPSRGLATLVMGLCANYAPTAGATGRFEWLYDSRGQWRPEAWKRWVDLDPLTAVTLRPDAFAAAQRVYLDGAEHDEFGANIGARKIYEVLRSRPTPARFTETAGHHSDRLGERLVNGLSWALGKR